MRHFETPSLPHKPISMTPEQRDLLRRRTKPFLDTFGTDRPLSLVLEEVYLQGMRDAVQAMEGK